jgi:hypothetical protein
VSLEYKKAEHGIPIKFNTSCDLKVLSTSRQISERWDGDVRYLADKAQILYTGFHPERSQLAIVNDNFKDGVENWGYRWVDVIYPTRDDKDEREYTVTFNDKGRVLTITCEGQVFSDTIMQSLASTLSQGLFKELKCFMR